MTINYFTPSFRSLGPRILLLWLLLITLNTAIQAAVTDGAEAFVDLETRQQVQAAMPQTPIKVKLAIKLDQITAIEQKSENFSAVISMLLKYQDPALAYQRAPGDPPFRMYRVESLLQLAEQRGTQWPELILLNQQGRRDITARVLTLSPEGVVHFYSRFTATLQAPDFDFRRFPFDHQQFHIRMLSVLPVGLFELEPLAGQSGIGDQLGEEEWVAYDPQVTVNTRDDQTGLPSSEFILSFKAHRHLMYYVVRIFIPMLVILLVSWFTFQLKDYVKRIDVGITTLLLFIAFNFTVSSDLPRLGYITAMDAFMTGAFVITGAVLLVNVYFRRLQTTKQDARAAQLDRYAFWGYWPAYVVGTSVALLLL